MPEPVKMEGLPPQPKPETPKPQVAAPKEKSSGTVKSNDRRKAEARGTLEQIAKGVPVHEATAAKTEALPSREAATALLAEANTILLELKDMRLLVNAIATQAADTPLGNEMQMGALRALAAMETDGLPSDTALKLVELQTKINDLNIPPANPQESAILPILEQYNTLHPENPLPPDIADSIRSGSRDSVPAVAQLLQTNNELAAMTWKQLTGVEGFTKLSPSPNVMLDLAGIPKTPENMKKASEMFGEVKKAEKPPSQLSDQVTMGIVYAAVGLQAFIQIATPESAEHTGGH
ncbi:MAG: hypothetical protein ACOY3M_01785 [Patescibacteria group bacterium]